MKLFVTVHNDARLLGHFLRHYRAIGVSHFYVAIPSELRPEAEERARDHPITFVEGLNVADSVSGGTLAVTQMRRAHQTADEWVVIVDLDEFIEASSLPSIAERADRWGANVVRGIMHDRFARDGQPRDFADEDDLSEVYPIKSRFVREVTGGCDHKGVLVKGHVWPRPGYAHHVFDDERLFCEILDISHFKWTGASIWRVRNAYEMVSSAGIHWAPEYRRALDHYERHGRFAWETFGGRPWREFVSEPPAGHCTECGGAIAADELAYSLEHFGRPLCREDQARERKAKARIRH